MEITERAGGTSSGLEGGWQICEEGSAPDNAFEEEEGRDAGRDSGQLRVADDEEDLEAGHVIVDGNVGEPGQEKGMGKPVANVTGYESGRHDEERRRSVRGDEEEEGQSPVDSSENVLDDIEAKEGVSQVVKQTINVPGIDSVDEIWDEEGEDDADVAEFEHQLAFLREKCASVQAKIEQLRQGRTQAKQRQRASAEKEAALQLNSRSPQSEQPEPSLPSSAENIIKSSLVASLTNEDKCKSPEPALHRIEAEQIDPPPFVDIMLIDRPTGSSDGSTSSSTDDDAQNEGKGVYFSIGGITLWPFIRAANSILKTDSDGFSGEARVTADARARFSAPDEEGEEEAFLPKKEQSIPLKLEINLSQASKTEEGKRISGSESIDDFISAIYDEVKPIDINDPLANLVELTPQLRIAKMSMTLDLVTIPGQTQSKSVSDNYSIQETIPQFGAEQEEAIREDAMNLVQGTLCGTSSASNLLQWCFDEFDDVIIKDDLELEQLFEEPTSAEESPNAWRRGLRTRNRYAVARANRKNPANKGEDEQSSLLSPRSRKEEAEKQLRLQAASHELRSWAKRHAPQSLDDIAKFYERLALQFQKKRSSARSTRAGRSSSSVVELRALWEAGTTPTTPLPPAATGEASFALPLSPRSASKRGGHTTTVLELVSFFSKSQRLPSSSSSPTLGTTQARQTISLPKKGK